jgi:hypothetical protein
MNIIYGLEKQSSRLIFTAAFGDFVFRIATAATN